eukprot:COSAG01_NODE_20004_length_976_cov_3.416192_2_plen_43_part_01
MGHLVWLAVHVCSSCFHSTGLTLLIGAIDSFTQMGNPLSQDRQ